MNTGPKNRAGRHRISQTMRRERRRLARSNSGSTQTKHTALCHHERASLPAATRAASELLATLGPKAPWGPGQARPLSTSESPTRGHAHGLMAAAAVSRCSRSPNQLTPETPGPLGEQASCSNCSAAPDCPARSNSKILPPHLSECCSGSADSSAEDHDS